MGFSTALDFLGTVQSNPIQLFTYSIFSISMSEFSSSTNPFSKSQADE